jgi:hypothetical protein
MVWLQLTGWGFDGDDLQDGKVFTKMDSGVEYYGICFDKNVHWLDTTSTLHIALDAFNKSELHTLLPELTEAEDFNTTQPKFFEVNIPSLLTKGEMIIWTYKSIILPLMQEGWTQGTITPPKPVIPVETYLKQLPNFGDF